MKLFFRGSRKKIKNSIPPQKIFDEDEDDDFLDPTQAHFYGDHSNCDYNYNGVPDIYENDNDDNDSFEDEDDVWNVWE